MTSRRELMLGKTIFEVIRKAIKDMMAFLVLSLHLVMSGPEGICTLKYSKNFAKVNESLTREVTEETGLNITVGEPFKTWSFTLPASHKNAGTKVFVVGHECAYLSGDVTISKEHTTSVWVNRHDFATLDDGSIWFEVLKLYFGRG